MASDMFIKIGDVKGESTDSAHKGEIDILSWSLAAAQQGTSGSGGGSGAGKVQIHDLVLTKYIDNASPTLFQMCCDGTHIKKCILTVRKAGGKQLEYLTIALDNSMVASIETGGKSGDDRLTETIRLNFAKIGMQYKPQVDGGAGGAGNSKGWDLTANVAWDAGLK
jgi:type VI secretion system secreted protein Hcp